MKRTFSFLCIVFIVGTCLFAAVSSVKTSLTPERKEATAFTQKVFEQIQSILDFGDVREFAFAQKGLIDRPEALEIVNSQGMVVFSQKPYSFLNLENPVPGTINPSLWRNAIMNHMYGLYKVTDGIYQVRGYDIANLTLIESQNGWIAIDVMMSVEGAQAAMQLVEKNLGKREIKAVVISHTHVDHFGGIKGLITQEDVDSGKVKVIAPEGFVEYAVKENVYAGTAMGRRATYQYGGYLPRDEKGRVSSGLGTEQAIGNISFILPTDLITATAQEMTIDGVRMIFQLTPGTEAPAEMNTYFPQKKALWMAENCIGSLHNLYTLRGAEVRDGLSWSKYIMEAYKLFGQDAEVVFQSHMWPHWGNAVLKEFLLYNAQIYRFIHDQTLHYANKGYTAEEIAEIVQLSPQLAKIWYIRPYYGTVSHNVKAVYQKYLGWYDGNPVNLNPLPPEQSAKKYVEYMGGAQAILERAVKDFENGEYRWVAEATSRIVFADATNEQARLLCADALEQMGYQAESGIWRNFYLSGALELRNGMQPTAKKSQFSQDVSMNMPTEMIFDYIAICIDAKKSWDKTFTIDFDFVDVGKTYQLCMENGTLYYFEGIGPKKADVKLLMPEKALSFFLLKQLPKTPELMQSTGDLSVCQQLFDLMEDFTLAFQLVAP